MKWKTFSLHFKQQYAGGYRYLDNCGAFMLDAESELNFMPADPKPSGAKLEIPEHCITANIDTTDLIVMQEIVNPNSHDLFIKTCARLSNLVQQHFAPRSITRNGFACKSYYPVTNSEEALKASLKFGGDTHVSLSSKLDMSASQKRIDFNFRSGSSELIVRLFPVTFEKVSTSRLNPLPNATNTDKARIDRQNQGTDKWNTPLNYALLLETDFMVLDPPANNRLESHFQELMRSTEILRTHFNLD